MISAICLTAYFLKGPTGFGPALVFVSTGSLVLVSRVARVASAFINLLVGLGIL